MAAPVSTITCPLVLTCLAFSTPVGWTATSKWGYCIGWGGDVTDLAASNFPAAFLTYLMVADPFGIPTGVAAGTADKTLGTASSIMGATLLMDDLRASDN